MNNNYFVFYWPIPGTFLTECNIPRDSGILRSWHERNTYYTILHDHLSVRKLCSRWIPHNLTEVQKQAHVKAKKCSRNSTKVGQIWSTTSLLGTKHGSIRMSPKVNNNPLFGYLKMNRNQQKLFVHAVLPCKWLLISSVVPDM